MNINDILPSENLLAVFRRLDTREVVKIREVCKLWWELIDENRMFWRILELSLRTLEETESTLIQFDEKSGSTLEELSFKVKWEESRNFNSLAQSILKSSQALQVLKMISVAPPSEYNETLYILTGSLILDLPNLVDFRASRGFGKVKLLRSNRVKCRSFLVLWIGLLQTSPSIDLSVKRADLFKSLRSLEVGSAAYGYSTWRNILYDCSQSPKHLGLILRTIKKRGHFTPSVPKSRSAGARGAGDVRVES